MQVEMEWEGRAWLIDTEAVTLAQAFVIQDTTKDDSWPSGRPLQPWINGVAVGYPACVRGLYWLMLQQDGQQRTIADLEFPVMKFHSAWVMADAAATQPAVKLREILAEAERQMAPLRAALSRREAAEAAEAAAAAEEAARPTRLTGGESQPSPEHGSPSHLKSSAELPDAGPASR